MTKKCFISILIFSFTFSLFSTSAQPIDNTLEWNGRLIGSYEIAYLYCTSGHYPKVDEFLKRYTDKKQHYSTVKFLSLMNSLSPTVAEFAFGEAVLEAVCTKKSFPECMTEYEKMLTCQPGDMALKKVIRQKVKALAYDSNVAVWFKLFSLRKVDPTYYRKTMCAYWADVMSVLVNEKVIKALKLR